MILARRRGDAFQCVLSGLVRHSELFHAIRRFRKTWLEELELRHQERNSQWDLLYRPMLFRLQDCDRTLSLISHKALVGFGQLGRMLKTKFEK